MDDLAAALRWGLAIVATLLVAAALLVSYQLGALHEVHRQLAETQRLNALVQTQATHERVLVTDRDYYKAADALGLEYFDVLRNACLPYRKRKP